MKYFTSYLSRGETEKEAQQMQNIPGLPLGKIGFIAVSGFEKNEMPYVQIHGDALYA